MSYISCCMVDLAKRSTDGELCHLYAKTHKKWNIPAISEIIIIISLQVTGPKKMEKLYQKQYSRVLSSSHVSRHITTEFCLYTSSIRSRWRRNLFLSTFICEDSSSLFLRNFFVDILGSGFSCTCLNLEYFANHTTHPSALLQT